MPSALIFLYTHISTSFFIARQRQIDRHTEKFIRNLISTSQPAGSLETNEILSTLKVCIPNLLKSLHQQHSLYKFLHCNLIVHNKYLFLMVRVHQIK